MVFRQPLRQTQGLMRSFAKLMGFELPAMTTFALLGLANLWLIATKDTALLAVVGFSELTLVTRQAASSTRAYFTFFLAAGALYLAVTLISTFIFRRLEKRARRGQAVEG